MILNLLALGAQLVLAAGCCGRSACTARCGCCRRCIFLGAAGVALGGGLVAALLLKGADGTLRYSLHRTGTELLFVPLPGRPARARQAAHRRRRAARRAGDGVAADPLARACCAAATSCWRGAAAATALVWIAWAPSSRATTSTLFRVALREGTMRRALDLPPARPRLAGDAVRRAQQPRRRRGARRRWTCWRRRAARG